MLEYQGWITIREAYNEENESTKKLKNIVTDIQNKVQKLQIGISNRKLPMNENLCSLSNKEKIQVEN